MTKTIEMPKTDFAYIKDVHWVNQKPHPFTIGPKHVAHAADHCCGMLGEESCRAYPCSAKGCYLDYDQHTKGDHVAFVYLTRNSTVDEMRNWLMSLSEWTENNKIDGFTFVDTGFRIGDELNAS